MNKVMILNEEWIQSTNDVEEIGCQGEKKNLKPNFTTYTQINSR